MSKTTIEIDLTGSAAQRLSELAASRGCTPAELARVYIEDWMDAESDQLKGRFSRDSIYRDRRMSIDERLSQQRV
jgi:hypothetical protein